MTVPILHPILRQLLLWESEQWGVVNNTNGNVNTYVTLPISATQNIGVLNVSDVATSDAVWNGSLWNSNTILITAWRPNGISLKGISAKWILVCF